MVGLEDRKLMGNMGGNWGFRRNTNEKFLLDYGGLKMLSPYIFFLDYGGLKMLSPYILALTILILLHD